MYPQPYPKTVYRQRLPHIQPLEGTFFITTRLNKTLAVPVILNLKEKFQAQILELKKARMDPGARWKKTRILHNELFLQYDAILDGCEAGPIWLGMPQIARIAADALKFYDDREYELICFTIMPNHIHVMIRNPEKPLFRILQNYKRYVATFSNRALKRKGAFWKRESYDHLVRDNLELRNMIRYMGKE